MTLDRNRDSASGTLFHTPPPAPHRVVPPRRDERTTCLNTRSQGNRRALQPASRPIPSLFRTIPFRSEPDNVNVHRVRPLFVQLLAVSAADSVPVWHSLTTNVSAVVVWARRIFGGARGGAILARLKDGRRDGRFRCVHRHCRAVARWLASVRERRGISRGYRRAVVAVTPASPLAGVPSVDSRFRTWRARGAKIGNAA